MSLPRSAAETSKSEKNVSISCEAERADVRYEETLLRKSESLLWSFINMLEARSITALCCNLRACSCGVMAGTVAREAGGLTGDVIGRLSTAGRDVVGTP